MDASLTYPCSLRSSSLPRCTANQSSFSRFLRRGRQVLTCYRKPIRSRRLSRRSPHSTNGCPSSLLGQRRFSTTASTLTEILKISSLEAPQQMLRAADRAPTRVPQATRCLVTVLVRFSVDRLVEVQLRRRRSLKGLARLKSVRSGSSTRSAHRVDLQEQFAG